MRCVRWIQALGLLAGFCMVPREVHANGRFPQAQYVVVGPGSADSTIALRATFGIVLSDDGGRTFRYYCEEAFEFIDGYDPSLALSSQGTVLVGVGDGTFALGADRCEAHRIADVDNQEAVDLATDPSGQIVYAALTSPDVTPVARVARSDDGGQTFTVPSAGLSNVVFETVDAAPSSPQRVYATGTDMNVGGQVLYRSDDGGMSFHPAGGSLAGAGEAYIAGVDPTNPDVLYVRATFAGVSTDAGITSPTALLRSNDGGQTLMEVTRTTGPMRGFALSDDGTKIYIGGPNDGLLRADDGTNFQHVNDVSVECLRYHAGALYVCETWVVGGVMLGRSMDEGASVQTLARFADVQGPARCAAGTIVGDICPLRWPAVENRIDPGHRDAGTSDVIHTTMDAGTDEGPGPMGTGPCSCRVPGHARSNGSMLGFLAAAFVLGRRVRARKANSSASKLTRRGGANPT